MVKAVDERKKSRVPVGVATVLTANLCVSHLLLDHGDSPPHHVSTDEAVVNTSDRNGPTEREAMKVFSISKRLTSAFATVSCDDKHHSIPITRDASPDS